MMMSVTNAESNPDTNSYSAKDVFDTEADNNSEHESISLRPVSRNGLTGTITAPSLGNVVIVRTETPNVTEQLLLKEKKLKEVEGSILSIEDVSVVCEIILPSGVRELRLPASIFSFTPRYGMAISISVDENNGVRRTIVSEREPDAELVKEGIEEISSLREQL